MQNGQNLKLTHKRRVAKLIHSPQDMLRSLQLESLQEPRQIQDFERDFPSSSCEFFGVTENRRASRSLWAVRFPCNKARLNKASYYLGSTRMRYKVGLTVQVCPAQYIFSA